MPTQSSDKSQPREPKAASDATKKEQEMQIVPENNLPLVFAGLMCCVFLAALDQTVVATALPTIVDHLGGGKDYSWVASAYMLAGASVAPFTGKLSDIIGRKPVLYAAIVIFLFGSALCGTAKTMPWLIACRAVQGIGGGSIFQLVNIIIGDITTLQERGKYGGLIGATFGIATVMGPLVGGLFTDHVTWKWCFWINLPTGAAAAAVLAVFLNLNPHRSGTFRQHFAEFDFIGLFLVVGGVVSVLLGFSFSEKSWTSGQTLALLVLGFVFLVSCGVHEAFTKKSPIIPPRLFKTRTTASILLSNSLHGWISVCGAYYLPVYYQALGASATSAGLMMLAYSVSASITSALAGLTISVTGDYRRVIWAAWAITLLGTGLMIDLDDTSSLGKRIGFPLIAGVGLGPLFEVPMIAMQAAMPVKHLATSIAAYSFIRTMGSTIGVSVGQTIFTSVLRNKLRGFPHMDLDTSADGLAQSVTLLKNIQDQTERQQLIHAYSTSISTIWIFCTPIVGLGLILSLGMKKYTFQRATTRAGRAVSPADHEMQVQKPAEGANTPSSSSAIAESSQAKQIQEDKIAADHQAITTT